MTTKVLTSQGERFLQAKLLTVLFLVREKYFARVYVHLLELHALPHPPFYHALLQEPNNYTSQEQNLFPCKIKVHNLFLQQVPVWHVTHSLPCTCTCTWLGFEFLGWLEVFSGGVGREERGGRLGVDRVAVAPPSITSHYRASPGPRLRGRSLIGGKERRREGWRNIICSLANSCVQALQHNRPALEGE